MGCYKRADFYKVTRYTTPMTAVAPKSIQVGKVHQKQHQLHQHQVTQPYCRVLHHELMGFTVQI